MISRCRFCVDYLVWGHFLLTLVGLITCWGPICRSCFGGQNRMIWRIFWIRCNVNGNSIRGTGSKKISRRLLTIYRNIQTKLWMANTLFSLKWSHANLRQIWRRLTIARFPCMLSTTQGRFNNICCWFLSNWYRWQIGIWYNRFKR